MPSSVVESIGIGRETSRVNTMDKKEPRMTEEQQVAHPPQLQPGFG
jgi:hypothetical protein